MVSGRGNLLIRWSYGQYNERKSEKLASSYFCKLKENGFVINLPCICDRIEKTVK